jgi:Protein of unknown function (DUF2958)
MELLPQEVRATIPPLYATENEPDPIVWVKYFNPWSDWVWYIIEFEEVEGAAFFYGWLAGSTDRPGQFMRSTLECMRAYYGLTIERDLHFEPCRLSTVKQPEQGG